MSSAARAERPEKQFPPAESKQHIPKNARTFDQWCGEVLRNLLLSFAAASGLAAQSLAKELPSVVVTGSRLPQADPEAVGSLSVLDRADLELRQPRTPVEAIRDLPGVWVDQPGGAGGISSIYMRGADPNFTLVLIDGVRVNDSTNSRGGSFDISTLPPEALERIEVVRGVRSAAYGSDALGGVVNFITLAAQKELHRSFESSFGTEGYKRLGVQIVGPLGPASAALAAGLTDHGEPDSGNTLLVRHANTKLELDLSDRTQLKFFGRAAEAEAMSFPDDSGGVLFAVRRERERRDSTELSGGLALDHRWTDLARFDVRIDGARRAETVDSPGVAAGPRDPFGIPASRSDAEYEAFSASASIAIQWLPTLHALAGFEWREEEGTNDSVLAFEGFELPGRFDMDRSIGSAFAEAQWRPVARLAVEAALRLDEAEGWDTQASPSAAVHYDIGWLGSTVYARWGKGFKLPSFYALGHPIVGNPHLAPETSRTSEVGIRLEPCAGRCAAELALFRSHYRNLVDFEEGPPPRLVNRSKAEIRGAEGRFRIDLSRSVRFVAHATYVDAELVGVDEELRNRPKWQAGTGVRFDASESLRISFQTLYVGRMHDSSIPTGDVVLDGYIRADLGLTWTPDPNWDLKLALDNLSDADDQETVGVPARGRSARAAVQFSF